MAADARLPAWHIRPSRGWLNDPNGIVHWHGRWHVFFQHNPAAAVHDRIHWGHVSSADLLTWREHPVAFGPQPGGPDRYGCWSGVFVGGLDRPAVAYSGLVDATSASTVCLRYGSADLETWSEPIVVGHTPDDVGVRVVRDPFVFRYAGRRWALLGAGMRDGGPGVLLYSCDDVEKWRFEQVWLTHDDPVARQWAAPADVWECPQLVWVDGLPVLVVSLHDRGVLRHVVALAGEVTEVHGRPSWRTVEAVRLDGGAHFYAPQLVQDGPNPLLFGWIRQQDSADPTDVEAVAGCLSFPRRLACSAGRLEVRLDPAVQALRRDGRTVTGPRTLALPPAAAVTAVEADGGRWGTLRGAEEPAALAGAAGAQAWVDGEVAEIFPGGGIPTTTRQPGTKLWHLDLEAGVVAEVAGLGLTGAAP